MERSPRQLSHELRRGDNSHLRRRRSIIGLTLGAIGCMGVVTLYQTGVLRRMPEPKLPGLDADKVDASDEAYELLETPDGALGLASYATTLVLAAKAGKDRAQTAPAVPLLLMAKATVDAVQAGKLTYDQFARHKAACSWCLMAAAASFAVAVLALPEARDAQRHLMNGKRSGRRQQAEA